MAEPKSLRADAQRNRDILIATARNVFEDGTFFDMRFDDLAALAGVGTGTLYRHFPTREALAEAVYGEELVGLCARARELQKTMPAYQALTAFLRGMVAHMHAHEGLARTLATLLTLSSSEPSERGNDLEDAVADLLKSGIAEGTVRRDASVGAVMMTLHGIGASYQRANWRSESNEVVTILLDGLRLPASIRV